MTRAVADTDPSLLDVLRAEECPACEGRGGVLLDDWGYEVDPCATCGGSGLREPEVTR